MDQVDESGSCHGTGGKSFLPFDSASRLTNSIKNQATGIGRDDASSCATFSQSAGNWTVLRGATCCPLIFFLLMHRFYPVEYR